MKQSLKLIILFIFTTSFHLVAEVITHSSDTIGKFNEVTDIELRLKTLMDTTTHTAPTIDRDTLISQQLDSLRNEIDENTTIEPVKKETLVNVKKDSIIIDKNLVLSQKQEFKPIVTKTSLDSIYNRTDNGIIFLPELEADITFPHSFKDTMLYNPLFLPVVFTGRIEDPDSMFVYPEKEDKQIKTLLASDNIFLQLEEKQLFAEKVKRDYYINNPTDVRISASKLKDIKQTATDTDVRERFNPFKELLSSQTSFSLEKPEIEGAKIKRVYWIKTGEHSLQFSQNYFSPNWHRGGTSNLNINSNQIFNVNYQKNKVKFNNRIEWRLSVFNAPDDTLRSYRIGDDMIRYYGDFGLDAYKKTWSYSTNLEAKSQLLKSYLPNKPELRASILAPLYVNIGVGMKYNLDRPSKSIRHRRVRLAVSISPLSANFKYVGNDEVDEKRFGIPEGKKSIFDRGSTLTSNLTYDISKYVTWTSRVKYFTNYSKVEAEFENTLNMALSQFFSTRLYLHLRYDDGVPAHEDYKYLQINEVVSFGLNYKW